MERAVPASRGTGRPRALDATLGTRQFSGQYLTAWARFMAFVAIVMIPAVVFYLVTERYILAGLTGGAVKG